MQPLTTAPERAPKASILCQVLSVVALDPIDKGRLCLPAFLLGESVANLRRSRTAKSMREMSQLRRRSSRLMSSPLGARIALDSSVLLLNRPRVLSVFFFHHLCN